MTDPAVSEAHLQEKGWTIDAITLQGADTPGVRHLIASGRIAAPARDVWAAISRSDKEEDRWPSLKEVVVERVDADTTIARFTMSVPIYPDRHYRLRTVFDHRRMRQDFELVPGYGNVRVIKGSWKVTALSDSLSHLRYLLDTDPGVRLVPGFVINWATRKVIPRSYAFVREKTLAHARVTEGEDERLP